MRRAIRQSLAVILALSMVAVPVVTHTSPQAVQTAKAEVWGDDCTNGHSLLLTVTNTAGITDNDLGCTMFPGETGTNDLDHNQTKTELVQRAATSNQHVNVTLDSFANNFQNTEAVARLEGQAAYYRSLENGSSQSAAQTAAEQAVRDYYAVKQIQLAESWNIYATAAGSYETVEANESLDSNYVRLGGTGTSDVNTLANKSQATVNGTQVEVVPIESAGHEFTPWDASHPDAFLQVGHSDSNITTVNGPLLKTWVDRWSSIESQESAVVSEMDTYINNTYSDYEAGEVNATELVDANTLTREFSPDEDGIQSWTSLMLSLSQDVGAPNGLDGLGNFSVSYQRSNYTGLLLADTQEVDSIETGQTYDGSNLTVTPKLVHSNGDVTDLNGQFTIHDIRDTSGASVGNVTYREVEYTTTNTTEYQQLMDELDTVRAELEDREEKRQGGAGWLPGSDRQKLGAVVLILGGGYLVARTREQSGVTVRTDGPPRRGR